MVATVRDSSGSGRTQASFEARTSREILYLIHSSSNLLQVTKKRKGMMPLIEVISSTKTASEGDGNNQWWDPKPRLNDHGFSRFHRICRRSKVCFLATTTVSTTIVSKSGHKIATVVTNLISVNSPILTSASHSNLRCCKLGNNCSQSGIMVIIAGVK